MSLLSRLHYEFSTARQSSPSLTAVSLLMSAAFPVSLAGLLLDPRTITGAPVWLKPAKFALSTAIYAGTLAWVFQYVRTGRRFVRICGFITAAVLVLEVAIIDFQAARGTISHFNVRTPLDATLWYIMAGGIALLWLAGIGITLALFRQRFRDPAFGWALRLGMTITMIGAGMGGMMAAPTQEQRLVLARAQQTPPSLGGHTVGAPDGGPGLPFVNWSSQHGDLRIPHFLGLHALQLIPLLYWLQTRLRRRPGTQFVFSIAASYLALFGILLWQARRGQSLVHPDAHTSAAFTSWLVLTTAALLLPSAKTHVQSIPQSAR